MSKVVEAYLASAPTDRRKKLDDLHKLIVALYPDATVDMQFKMPTYRHGEGWVAIANQKNYISLYTCGEIHLRAFKRKHPKVKTGKGCINFKPSDDLPVADIKQVVQHAIEHPKG